MLIPKVSVVVPIYKVEPYIERCVRSLFEQTLAEVEYIFVNDCTPDRSIDVLKQVLEAYPERKPWVKIIDMPQNSGQAKAREVGIKATTGEYVIHCDSDDWVDTDMYRAMYDKAVSEELDIVSCNFCSSTDQLHWSEEDLSWPKDKGLFQSLLSQAVQPSLVVRLIKGSLCRSPLRYPKGDMGEDQVLMLQYAFYSRRVAHLSISYYRYCLRPSSISYQDNDEAVIRRATQLEANVKILESWLSENNLLGTYYDELVKLKYTARRAMCTVLWRSPRKYHTLWCSIFPEINREYPYLRSVSWKFRLIFILTLWGIYPYFKKWFTSDRRF